MFEHKTFIRFVDKSFEKGLDIVCLSIVQTEGSTYQKPGSTMLVNSAKEMVGFLSGGCIEEALLHCCEEVLQKRHGKLVTHDLRLPDDSLQSWEEGVGCNGLIQVWLEPFYHSNNYGILGEALSYAKEGIPTTLYRSLLKRAETLFLETKALHVTMYDEKNKTLIQPIDPSFKVLILGVGSAVQAVVDMANILGWQTYVCDTRTEALDAITHADHKLLFRSATECETLLVQERFDACVIMSHLFKADSFYLKSALNSKAFYIGLLGSKTRSHKIVEFLGESITLDERFHAPIGLGIGAKTPQAIALSICAQIESEKTREYSMQNDLAILIVAAGSSTRLGHPKQLVTYQNETLLRRSVKQALELSPNVFVILGHEYEACLSSLEGLHVNALYHENYTKGIGSSIAFGITHTQAYDNTLIMLCDQPLIPLEHYRALMNKVREECLIASSYLPKERVAVPAIFPKRYYEYLMALSGDKGAQMLLSDVSCIRISLKKEFTVDIDTQEDIATYLL